MRAIAGLPYPPDMIERSLRLSNGPGVAGRVIGVAAGAVFVVGGSLFAVMASIGDRFVDGLTGTGDCTDPGDLGGLPRSALPPDMVVCSGPASEHLGVIGLAGLVLGGGLAVLGLFVAVRWLRAAAWLDGAVLRVRGAVRSRRVDLATAEVTLGTVTHTSDDDGIRRVRRVPTLVARDPAGGRPVRLALSGGGLDRLPPAELRALGDAVTASRPVSQADAWRVASQLQQMADNPLDLPLR